MSLKEIYSPIQSELNLVTSKIKTSLQSTDNKPLLELGHYLASTPGKQVRSALLLLSLTITAQEIEVTLSEDNKQNAITIAAAIELIHLASLVHDDIIDESDKRRGKASIYAKHGSKKAIVSGVYLYAIALKLIASVGNNDLLTHISESVQALCEGEYTQLSGRNRFDSDLNNYLSMIRNKTSVLFASAAYSGVRLISSNTKLLTKMERLGLSLGSLFQLTDDYLDLFGKGLHLLKKPGQDIVSGEYTLPFYILRDSLSTENQKQLRDLLNQSDKKDALTFIKTHSTPEVETETRTVLKQELDEARSILKTVKHSHYKDSLYGILDKVSERCFEKETV